ncbi:MAG: ABC transporter permease [Deltaproteobacteria bacterium]|jgi:NitT/TauT family transport system permease protein|nr:ABC transporter permease [Deltaproteobacteria bacterium]
MTGTDTSPAVRAPQAIPGRLPAAGADAPRIPAGTPRADPGRTLAPDAGTAQEGSAPPQAGTDGNAADARHAQGVPGGADGYPRRGHAETDGSGTGVGAERAPSAAAPPAGSALAAAAGGTFAFLWRQKALAAALAALAVQLILPDSGKHPTVSRPYYAWALSLSAAFFLLRPVIFAGRREALEAMRAKDLFTMAAFLLLALSDVLTAKATVLPTLFFPTPDRILAVLCEDFRYLVLDCLGSSARLLVAGFFSGAAAGLATGILIGFSRGAAYWLNPLIKFLGPIPPTAWIPIVLVAFPTTWTGAVFLIALSVWFPTSVMTSSGILNVQNAYFEVSRTLGAGRVYQVFMVGIPAAMPLIFTGLFSGACASFLTLMTAEMIGVKNGIGWYIHWQRQMLAYANVYAGLIVVALTFYSLITLFFKARDRMLVWQKGMIKW